MPETSDSHLECGDLSPLCLSNTAFLSISLGEQQVFHFQFQVNSIVQTNIVSRAKLPEKESGDESPHSKGRLFRGQGRKSTRMERNDGDTPTHRDDDDGSTTDARKMSFAPPGLLRFCYPRTHR